MTKPGLTLADIPDLVSVQEAAAATRLSVHAIRVAIRSGEIPAFIPGGRSPRAPGPGMGYRMTRSDLQAWFFGQQVPK